MKKLFALHFIILASIITLTFSCNKSKTVSCEEKQKERFKCYGTTPKNSAMYEYLAAGTYKSQEVYFKNISCIACNTVPPSWGLNCAGDTIRFDAFSNVTGMKIVSICE